MQTVTARDIYFHLFNGQASQQELDTARPFLEVRLQEAAQLGGDLPDEMKSLTSWMEESVEQVGRQYAEYLKDREAGAPRRYFKTKSHALHFLKGVAPTKMVDGAWLYGLLPRWQDTRFASLIETYLEELGDGLPTKNHVVLYRKLLASQGCSRWDDLSEDHFVQGAIQLALAYQAEHYLPEIIGYNLGYEQLPLHLLITAYELKELRIDPYYFTLHVTVDNADSGHAKKAVDAVREAMPHLADQEEWYERVRTGFKLNNLGASTLSVINSFNLDREMEAIMARKSSVGKNAHSNYRRIGGRTVNEWLAEPAQAGEFIAEMEKSGWFNRHGDPSESRFWKLIEGEKAKMYGVFDGYEQQVIYDWISGDAVEEYTRRGVRNSAPQSLTFESKQQAAQWQQAVQPQLGAPVNDFDLDEQELEGRIAAAGSEAEEVAVLINLMSPAHHHSAPGLMATRLFKQLFH